MPCGSEAVRSTMARVTCPSVSGGNVLGVGPWVWAAPEAAVAERAAVAVPAASDWSADRG
ncbi:hypothetical protein [Nisaea sp.]|uniref:hypothetical protein n=1 Tax=Nisaea sp. TaxID=2024842 RepID=UPI003B522601